MSVFNSTDEMESYFCAPTWNYTIDNYAKGSDMCPFPYVPKGFAWDGEEGFDDAELGDCSKTYADATGGQYTMMCLLYIILTIPPWLVSVNFVFVFRKKRLESKKKDVLSLAEKMLLLAAVGGFLNWFSMVDAWGYAGIGGLSGCECDHVLEASERIN